MEKKWNDLNWLNNKVFSEKSSCTEGAFGIAQESQQKDPPRIRIFYFNIKIAQIITTLAPSSFWNKLFLSLRKIAARITVIIKNVALNGEI